MDNEPKVLIGVAHTQTVYADFMWSFISILSKDPPPGTEVLPVGSKTLIDAARNNIATHAIDGRFTHVMFLDSDQTFLPHTLNTLLSRDKDVITGIYPQRSFYLKPVIYAMGEDKESDRAGFKHIIEWDPNGGPFEVDMCGAGCLLIKTSVLKKIGTPFFSNGLAQDGRYKGEDVFFCEKVKNAGFHIWADPAVTCGHLDTIEFTIDQFIAQRDRKKVFVKSNLKETFTVKCKSCGKEFDDTMEGEVLYDFLYGDRDKLNIITDCPHCNKPMKFQG